MPITAVQEEFVRRFNAYMADAKAYGSLYEYVKGLKDGSQLRECLSKYLDIAGSYRGREERERSLRVFFDVSLLALQKSDAYFALRLDALVQHPGLAWQTTYSELGATQRRK